VLTSRGKLVAATGAGLFVAGALFGTQSLWQLGLALIALVGAATAVVRLGKHHLVIGRSLSPNRARPGQTVSVAIEIANKGTGSAPFLLLEERLPGGLAGGNRFAVRGIEPGGERRTTLQLRAARRGRYEVGPLEVSVVDPFGLAQLRTPAIGRDGLLVHPRIERLVLPRDPGDRRSPTLSTLRRPTGARGEDFYTMREYVEGDDLRKIHWPSTAKRDRYMIRQEETPWQTRATILLDDRAVAHEGHGGQSSFERAVEAAASFVDLYDSSGYNYRLLGLGEPGFASSRGAEHRSRCLDYLAVIAPARAAGAGALTSLLAELEGAATAEASLVLVSGSLSAADALALTRSRRRFGEVTVVAFPSHRFSGQTTKSRWEGEARLIEAVRMLARAGVRALALGPDDSLAAGWATLFPARPLETAWGRRTELV
jgi:uncharacterized protein (DUF58 family)